MRWLVALAFVLATGDAFAHGRVPTTTGVRFDADDPDSLYVATTFGLLVSHDRHTFYWVCENRVGYGDPYEPDYEVARGGTIFATSFQGLRISRDGGCSFETAPQLTRSTAAIDLASDGALWAVTNDAATNEVLVSRDNGMTFVPGGLAQPIMFSSIEVAPSDPTRVYVGGQASTSPFASHLFRHGATWVEAAMTGVPAGAYVIVAGVDPVDPDIVYVISSPGPHDELYRSTDGGETFARVLVTEAASWIRGITFRAGAVYVTRSITVGDTAFGASPLVSTNGGLTFGPVAGSPQAMMCLGVAPDGDLVGCASNWDPDYQMITRSRDATTWEKQFRLIELAGPVQCTSEPIAASDAVCEVRYCKVELDYGIGPGCDLPSEAPPATDGGCCSAGNGRGTWLLVTFVVFVLARRRVPR